MQVLAQSLAALATPQAEQQEPETSEETHQSEDSSETSPATGEATLSPPPDSPNTDLVAPEAARNTTVKVEPAAPLVDRIAGKNAADLESMESHGPVGSLFASISSVLVPFAGEVLTDHVVGTACCNATQSSSMA